MLFARAHHARGSVEDGDEVGVEAGAAAYGAAVEEEEGGLGSRGGLVGGCGGSETLAEALRLYLWARGVCDV